jgi:hypothetical protein
VPDRKNLFFMMVALPVINEFILSAELLVDIF